MSYTKANEVLPRALLCAVQMYIDGAYIYIPRKDENKLSWGANTGAKDALRARNNEILTARMTGKSVAELSEQYFLSEKSIYKILNAAKKC